MKLNATTYEVLKDAYHDAKQKRAEAQTSLDNAFKHQMVLTNQLVAAKASVAVFERERDRWARRLTELKETLQGDEV